MSLCTARHSFVLTNSTHSIRFVLHHFPITLLHHLHRENKLILCKSEKKKKSKRMAICSASKKITKYLSFPGVLLLFIEKGHPWHTVSEGIVSITVVTQLEEDVSLIGTHICLVYQFHGSLKRAGSCSLLQRVESYRRHSTVFYSHLPHFYVCTGINCLSYMTLYLYIYQFGNLCNFEFASRSQPRVSL